MALTSYPLVSITAGAANTKGSYTQIVASTPYASSRVHVLLRSANTVRQFFLLDLATGAAGVETVQVANLALDCGADAIAGDAIAIDVDVPAGTRLAARCQSVTASAPFALQVLLEDRALGGLAAPVTYGTQAANSRGTPIDPGAVANTKSAYVELSASTTARIDALAICATVSAQGGTLAAFTSWQIDVATGAAGAEAIVIADLVVQGNINDDRVRPGCVRLPVAIPAGTRLAIRHASNRTTAVERQLSLSVIGMQEPASGSGGAAAVAYVG
jgi:hypothetical protein